MVAAFLIVYFFFLNKKGKKMALLCTFNLAGVNPWGNVQHGCEMRETLSLQLPKAKQGLWSFLVLCVSTQAEGRKTSQWRRINTTCYCCVITQILENTMENFWLMTWRIGGKLLSFFFFAAFMKCKNLNQKCLFISVMLLHISYWDEKANK